MVADCFMQQLQEQLMRTEGTNDENKFMKSKEHKGEVKKRSANLTTNYEYFY